MCEYELIAFIWIVGWLYACGHADWAKEKVKAHDAEWLEGRDVNKPTTYAIMFFFWPHYLGYRE